MNPNLLVAARVVDSLYRIAYTSLLIYALYQSAQRGEAPRRYSAPRTLH